MVRVEEQLKEFNKSGLESSGFLAGFQGFEGSFSEQALDEYFGTGAEKRSFLRFEEVFQAVERGEVDRGIVPVENSCTGGIAEIYDLLQRYDCYIVGEKIIRVEQNLLVLPGTEIGDIKEVYSHPQGFHQAEKFLKAYSDWKLVPYYNTAVSASYVRKENNKKKAAIAGKRAAELYNLHILRENINSHDGNYTRFIVVGREKEAGESADKISVVFSLGHRPGTLYSALEYFAVNKINLLKIESRPIIGRPWEYYFYVDFQGTMKDKRVEDAVRLVREKSSYFKLLGNYQADIFSLISLK